jgi:hypothetical protein
MYTDNWFKLHRKLFKNEIWEDIALFRFFVYLIGQAVFSKKGVKKGSTKIKRGQLLKSYRKIQDELEYIENNSVKNYSLSRIKRMIEKLKEKEMIKTESTQLGTLFTIVNYSKYQDKEQEKDNKIKELRTELEQHKNSIRTVAEQQRNNNKNVKESKEGKECIKDQVTLVRNFSKFQTRQFKKVLPPNQRPKFAEDTKPYQFAAYLRDKVLENNKRENVPVKTPKGLEDWAVEFDRLNRLGTVGAKNKGYTWNEIDKIINWCQDDSFWKKNIKSASKLRKQVVQLEDRMKSGGGDNNGGKEKQISGINRTEEEGRTGPEEAIFNS